jgi:serine/threonine protein kinase
MGVQLVDDLLEYAKEMGHGVSSKVFRAVDPCTLRPVALKVISEACSRSAYDHAETEAEIQRLCQHPNVCEMHYFISGPPGKQRSLVIVMEYGGIPLTDVTGLFLPEPLLKCVAAQLLAGLANVHERGVVHRDVKLANILLDSFGVVRLADFGLAAKVGKERCLWGEPDRLVTVCNRPPDMLLGATSHR